jgi:hypothetical protein
VTLLGEKLETTQQRLAAARQELCTGDQQRVLREAELEDKLRVERAVSSTVPLQIQVTPPLLQGAHWTVSGGPIFSTGLRDMLRHMQVHGCFCCLQHPPSRPSLQNPPSRICPPESALQNPPSRIRPPESALKNPPSRILAGAALGQRCCTHAAAQDLLRSGSPVGGGCTAASLA